MSLKHENRARKDPTKQGVKQEGAVKQGGVVEQEGAVKGTESVAGGAKQGDKVKVHYTGTLDGGQVFDSSEGRDPLEFTVGSGQVIAGFDHAVTGMKVNEEKSFTLTPEEAYGEPKKEIVADLPKGKLPEGVKDGMTLLFKDPAGNNIPLRVKAVGESTVTVDLNHPLAGKSLHFKITLVAIG